MRDGLTFFDRVGGSQAIFAIRPNGTGLRLFAQNGLEPSVSPDGMKIAFESQGQAAGFDLSVIDADGSHRHVIYRSGNTPGTYVDSPSFSPDGNNIIFGTDGSSFRVVGVDGSHPHVLLTLHRRFPNAPKFAPDGATILFDEEDGQLDRLGLFMANADGTHVRRVRNTRDGDRVGAFSPDGKTIVFSCGAAVCRMGVNGSGRRQLTHPPTGQSDFTPQFSPDGKEIVFERGGQTTGGLFVMHSNGTQLHKINGNVLDDDPAWQPL